MRFKDDQERLVAEQAVLNYRELQRVMSAAPCGKGLAVLEQAVREKGFEQMRQTLSLLASAHAGAQKRGSTPSRVAAGPRPTSNAVAPSIC